MPLRPLYFDRVNEGKAPVSETLLFRVPLEITGQILECLPRSSLASLALTCRDCRQPARSRQFASINLDYSGNSLALIKKLVAEVAIRRGSYGSSNSISQSLGACIRRITVATHPVRMTDKFLSLRKRTGGKHLAIASKNPFGCYLQEIISLLSSKTALPHLEWLDWRDQVTVPCSLFRCPSFKSIQHLRLVLDEGFEIELPKTSEKWPLRTLYLKVHQRHSNRLEMGGSSTRSVCPSILRHCASTLESLTWQGLGAKEQHSFATYKMDLLPHFSRLTSLSLRSLSFTDFSVLDALLEGNLHEVAIASIAPDSLCSDFFENRGIMPALETLVWTGSINHQSLAFLRENPQISKLSLELQARGAFLEGQLLPLLTRSFRKLTSLSLHLENPSIPASVLDAINSLMTLQQLHLTAGGLSPVGRDWFIDHAMMRNHLKDLTSLKRMAFSRDAYDYGNPLESYYQETIGKWHRECTSIVNQKLWLPEQG